MQSISSYLYLAGARPNARADEVDVGTCLSGRPLRAKVANWILAPGGAHVISIEPGSGPTVRRILLGTQLRRLRESQGITREAAGYRIRASESKISRLELGRVGFKDRDISDLLELYGVEDETQREALVALAREANSPGWWHSYDDVLPNWFQTYVGLEEAASL